MIPPDSAPSYEWSQGQNTTSNNWALRPEVSRPSPRPRCHGLTGPFRPSRTVRTATRTVTAGPRRMGRHRTPRADELRSRNCGRSMQLRLRLLPLLLAGLVCGSWPPRVLAGSCTWEWETTQTDPDANEDAQTIGFKDSGKVAAGFTVAVKLKPTPKDVSGTARYTDMGLVSQCSCKCGTAPETPPAHSGMLLSLKKIGSGTGVMLAFLGPGATSESSWLIGPEVPPGTLSEAEMSFTPDPGGATTGTVRLSVGSETKTFTKQAKPGGFGPYHYPWRVGWQGGGGKKCRDHAGEKLYDCGAGCNQFEGTFDYAALCTGDCQPGECLTQAASEASDNGLLLAILLWFAGTAYVGGGVAWGRRQGRTSSSSAADSGGNSSRAAATRKIANVVGAHPHWQRWVELAALVEDGVAFSAAVTLRRGDGGRRRGGGYGYTPLPEAADKETQEGHDEPKRSSSSRKKSEKRGRSRGSGGKEKSPSGTERKKSSKRRSDGAKGGKQQQPDGLGPRSAAAETTTAKAAADEERERMLHEQRSGGVHSSQQAIKVVGLGLSSSNAVHVSSDERQ